MNSLKLLFVAGLAATAASALTVTPPANTWARHGHNATLECRASDPGVRSSCTWATPYGATFTLEAGLTAEGGRLRQEGRDNGCALVISGVEERDEGAWMCTLAVVKDSEVTSATGRSKLTLAKKPTSVRLAGTVVSKKISTNSNDEAIDCIVSDAAPKPNFSWFVGEDELEGNTVDNQKGQEWIQTLKYYPDSAHANQTLRCVVEHIGFDEKDDKEAGVVLRFTEDVKASSTTGFFEGYREVVRRTGNDTSVVIPYVLVGFACLLFGSAVYFGVHKAKTCWRERAEGAAAGAAVAEDAEKTANVEDVESQQSGEKKDEKKDEEKSVSEEKTDEEAKPNGRFQWVPKFFIPKTKSANKESAADEVDIEKPATDEEINASTAENKGFVAIDVNEDKTENDDEAKKTEEGEEKADSVKEVNEEEEEKAARPSFAARVAKMLRKSSKSQPKNETEMSEEVQKEETEKEEESKAEEKPETEEKVEMEETSKTAEKEVEEKTGPKNTDV